MAAKMLVNPLRRWKFQSIGRGTDTLCPLMENLKSFLPAGSRHVLLTDGEKNHHYCLPLVTTSPQQVSIPWSPSYLRTGYVKTTEAVLDLVLGSTVHVTDLLLEYITAHPSSYIWGQLFWIPRGGVSTAGNLPGLLQPLLLTLATSTISYPDNPPPNMVSWSGVGYISKSKLKVFLGFSYLSLYLEIETKTVSWWRDIALVNEQE